LAKLLRFPSTNNAEGVTSLEAYVDRMKDDQKAIYYISGEDVSVLSVHPTIEKLKARGYEVFLLTDPLDEHAMQALGEFQSHKISDTSRATLKMDESEMDKKRQKAIELMYKPLLNWYKDLLGAQVEKVVISKRLENTVGAVVAGDYGWTANMERIMESQVFSNKDSMGYMKSRKTFELNPNHPVVKDLLEKVGKFADEAEAALDAAEEADDEETAEAALSQDSEAEIAAKDSAVLLYQTCLINSGFQLPADSSNDFSDRLQRLVRVGLGISLEAKVEELEVEVPEDEPEEVEDAVEEVDMDAPDDVVEEEAPVEDDAEAPAHEEL
jgi:heat shock protein beta